MSTENYYELAKKYNIDVDASIRLFRRIYPEISTVSVVGLTKNKKFIVIFVGDGYHAINDNTVSIFYLTKEDAIENEM